MGVDKTRTGQTRNQCGYLRCTASFTEEQIRIRSSQITEFPLSLCAIDDIRSSHCLSVRLTIYGARTVSLCD